MAKSKKLKVKAGDILAIPTKKEDTLGYLLARVIQEKQSTLIEVFDKFYTDFEIDKQALAEHKFKKSDRLFLPISVILLFEDNDARDKWKILSHSNDFNPSIAKEGLSFVYPDYAEIGSYTENGVDKKDPPENRNRDKFFEDTTYYQTSQLIFRVLFYINSTYSKGDVFNLGKVMGVYHKAGTLDSMLSEATQLSISVAEEFEKVS